MLRPFGLFSIFQKLTITTKKKKKNSLDETKAQSVVDEIRKMGGSAIAVAGDVGADDFPDKVVNATVKEYGKINHIVNNGR